MIVTSFGLLHALPLSFFSLFSSFSCVAELTSSFLSRPCTSTLAHVFFFLLYFVFKAVVFSNCLFLLVRTSSNSHLGHPKQQLPMAQAPCGSP